MKKPKLAMTGLRLPPDVLTRLDTLAQRLASEPRQMGRVTRNSLVTFLLRESLDARQITTRPTFVLTRSTEVYDGRESAEATRHVAEGVEIQMLDPRHGGRTDCLRHRVLIVRNPTQGIVDGFRYAANGTEGWLMVTGSEAAAMEIAGAFPL